MSLSIKIITILSRLTYGINVTFKPFHKQHDVLEYELLKYIQDFVSDEYIETFSEHVSRINLAQRQVQTTVLFEWKFPGWFDWKRKNYFEPREGIKKLVNYEITFDTGKKVSGNIVSIGGVLCNMTFSQPLNFLKNEIVESVKIKKGSIVNESKLESLS